MRSGDWKLIYRWEPHREYPETRELYDLGKDPGETTNLAKEHSDQVARLEKLIERFIAETGAVAPIPNPAYREPAVSNAAAGKKSVVTKSAEGPVPKFCEAKLGEGMLKVTGTGRRPFLGTAQARFEGPLKVRVEIQAPVGGVVQCQWKEADQEEFPQEGQIVEQTLSATGDWQVVELDLPLEGVGGLLRLHLPDADGKTVAIRSYRIAGADGRVKEWRFGE